MQRAAPPPPASTAPTDSPQQAFVAPQAMPATASAPAAPASGVTGVVSNVLAWVGLASLASNSPTAPVESPALWAVCAWCRRQSQQTLADETPSIDAKPTQTSLILADQSVAGEALALTAAMAVANAAPQPTALPTVGAPDQATGAVSQPAGATPAASVQAIFSLVERDTRQGPFPSNRFTVGDADQNTGLRVDLPLPDPAVRPSDYADISVINTLDGFNITPRISIPFNGEIDLETVNSDTVFLQKLGSTLPNNGPGNARVGINQIVWDAATTTLHFTADEVLDQHTRYVLVVTTGVKDKNDNPIGSKAFKRFLDDQNFGQTGDPRLKDYHTELLDALAAVQKSGVKTNDVVVASVFTTRSVTTELEKIHEQIQAAPAPTVSDLQTFQLDSVTDITFGTQTTTAGNLAQPVSIINLLRSTPGAIGTVAFGTYMSPDYRNAQNVIPPTKTKTGAPVPLSENEITFDLYLPSGTPPPGGWPIAIVGHGATGAQEQRNTGYIAATLAEKGIATIAINGPGNGGGPLSTLTVTRSDGSTVTILSGGRGADTNGDGIIAPGEGASAAFFPIRDRDRVRQTAVDLMQLVRVIDTLPDLDASRIYYAGQSFGGTVRRRLRCGGAEGSCGRPQRPVAVPGLIAVADQGPTSRRRRARRTHAVADQLAGDRDHRRRPRKLPRRRSKELLQ